MFDTDLRYVVARGPLLARHGFGATELEGRQASDALPAGLWSRYEPLYRAALEGETNSVEVEGPDGSRGYLVNVSPLRDAGGEIVGGVHRAVDASAPRRGRPNTRRRVESLVARDGGDEERAAARFRGLLESAPDAMVITDARGRIVLANAHAEDLFGYRRVELVGLAVEALVPQRVAEVHAEYRARFAGDPRIRPMAAGLDLYARRRDGLEVPVEISLSPLETPEGMTVVAAIRDVSEHRRAELALREAEERFRRAFDEAPIGMAMLDLDGRFIEVNEALTAITGHSRDELEQTSLEAITHPDDLDAEQQAIAREASDGVETVRTETRLVNAHKHQIWIALHVTLVRDADGGPAALPRPDPGRHRAQPLRGSGCSHLADHDPLDRAAQPPPLRARARAHLARVAALRRRRARRWCSTSTTSSTSTTRSATTPATS